MHDPDDPTPRRFRRLPRGGPLRVLAPWACVGGGIVMIAKGVVDLQARDDALFVLLGSGMIVLGVATFLINRWQERRGS